MWILSFTSSLSGIYNTERRLNCLNSEKKQSILEYSALYNLKQLRRFLDMSSWYHRFISQFVTISQPLTRLLKKKINVMNSVGRGRGDKITPLSKFVRNWYPLRCYRVPILSFHSSCRPPVLVSVCCLIDCAENIAFANRALSDPEKKHCYRTEVFGDRLGDTEILTIFRGV